MLQMLFETGRVVDIALAVIVAEILVLAWLARRRSGGRPSAVAGLVWNAGAGAGLLLALRSALTGAGWGWTAAFLTLALVAHIGDVVVRMTQSRPDGVRSTGPMA